MSPPEQRAGSTPTDRGRRPAKDAAPIDQVSNLRTMLRPTTGPGSVWIVTYVVSGGRTRRSAYLSSAGADRAAERHRDAGRPALVTRARIDRAVVARTSPDDQPDVEVDQGLLDRRRADTVTRIAWLRHSADLLYAVDETGLLSANMRDLAYVLEAEDERGSGR